MNFKKILLSLLISFLIIATAKAGTGCSFGVGSVNFGSYDILSNRPNDSVGSVDCQCSKDKKNYSVNVVFSGGNSPTYDRYMLFQNEKLLYNLFVDYNRQLIWGSNGQNMICPGDDLPHSLVVYGRIFPGQNISVGPYTDSLMVTFLF